MFPLKSMLMTTPSKIRIQRMGGALIGLLLVASSQNSALAAQAPTEDGLWYYEIGGAEPVSPPANPSVVSVTLGGSVSLTWGQSCGKFDPVAAVTHTLDRCRVPR
jgi:hypothetical protein